MPEHNELAPAVMKFAGLSRFDDGVYLPCITLEYGGREVSLWAMCAGRDMPIESEAEEEEWAEYALRAVVSFREMIGERG